jgi:hypothetical protein
VNWTGNPEVDRLITEVLVAILLALLSLLGYERSIARPRKRIMDAKINGLHAINEAMAAKLRGIEQETKVLRAKIGRDTCPPPNGGPPDA